MGWSVDARVPVRFGTFAEVGDGEAVLVEGAAPCVAAESFVATGALDLAPGHVPGCACCVQRSGAGVALARLFERRARGETGFFRAVVAVTTTPEGRSAVEAALAGDIVASARFRLASRAQKD